MYLVEKISVLGSTGSIGVQTLEVVKKLGLRVSALAAHSNINLLEKQIREFSPEVVAVYDEVASKKLKECVADTKVKIVSGMDGLCEVAAFENTDLVLNAVVGMVGLRPTLEAIKAKKNVAIANKETLVVGGKLVTSLAKEKNVKLLPVDSEHSAIFQCLQGCNKKQELKKIILTASGGPFFGKTRDQLKNISTTDALKHPNWSMGAKITTDSATLMNKGLEVIEAVWLFDVKPEDIDIVVHRESIVHSMIEYKDNSVIAQMGLPDMRIPIQYAITYPERVNSLVGELDLTKFGKLSFFKPDNKTFKGIEICKKAINLGGTAPTIVNGANEEAVSLFLSNRISFLEIADIVEEALLNVKMQNDVSLNSITEADQNAREFVLDTIKRR